MSKTNWIGSPIIVLLDDICLYNNVYLDDMEQDVRICPKFTAYELSQIDRCVGNRIARNRVDFVRKATLAYIERTMENVKE